MAEPFKAYYNTREARAMTGLPASTLRYWEEQFDELAPHKDGHGNRYYTESDLDFIKRVKFIRDELKITRIEAIRRELKSPTRKVDVREQAVSILENVRKKLADIRANL